MKIVAGSTGWEDRLTAHTPDRAAPEDLNLYGSIFQSVTSGLCIVDAKAKDMPITYVNPAFEAITGYFSAEVIGKNCRFLQGLERHQPGVAQVRSALADHRKVTVVLKNYRRDGTLFWNELFISPIFNMHGELTHYVGLQNDVTARMELEAALLESEKLAAVGRLAASIAHEINNPLESITNLVYLAQGSKVESETAAYLALAEQELRRVKLITARSLRFYKQTTSPIAIHCEELVQPVLDVYLPRMTEAGIELTAKHRNSEGVTCMESEIRQVLNNLISNAMDAMKPQGGRLFVRSRDATAWCTGERGVVITVADTGTGIAAADMMQLTKAFFTTKGVAGTGLGLWISKEIVERHGGRLRVRSRQRATGGGTVMQMFLPCEGAPGLARDAGVREALPAVA